MENTFSLLITHQNLLVYPLISSCFTSRKPRAKFVTRLSQLSRTYLSALQHPLASALNPNSYFTCSCFYLFMFQIFLLFYCKHFTSHLYFFRLDVRNIFVQVDYICSVCNLIIEMPGKNQLLLSLFFSFVFHSKTMRHLHLGILFKLLMCYVNNLIYFRN